jgi:hypothetical protein
MVDALADDQRRPRGLARNERVCEGAGRDAIDEVAIAAAMRTAV